MAEAGGRGGAPSDSRPSITIGNITLGNVGQRLEASTSHFLQQRLHAVSAFVEESEKAGSADVRYQVDHPDANNFVVESIVSSGLQGSRRDAIGELTRELREKMSESEAKFYLHGVYFSTYRYKSERESLDLRSERRRKRK